jgi:hypothetical protein
MLVLYLILYYTFILFYIVVFLLILIVTLIILLFHIKLIIILVYSIQVFTLILFYDLTNMAIDGFFNNSALTKIHLVDHPIIILMSLFQLCSSPYYLGY